MTAYPETDTREGNEKYCIAWSRMENQESVCGLLGYVQSYEKTMNLQFLPSKNPLMKFCGRLAFGSSSARKYFRIWGSCFQ